MYGAFTTFGDLTESDRKLYD